jgi:TetR/AcrR family transcriptional regulator
MKSTISTEEKIIQAAIKEFSTYGFAGARVDRIAKSAKINKAMIYYHYKSKESLYETILSVPADGIFEFVRNLIPDGKADINQMYYIISKYSEYLNNLDPALIRIILGEISGGGKYLRKIVFPKLINPIIILMTKNLNREINNKTIRTVNPYHTLLHIIGSIIFFNIIKIALQGTELYETVFAGNYLKDFNDNLIEILRHGIELKENAQ